jgi:hypothetical protein
MRFASRISKACIFPRGLWQFLPFRMLLPKIRIYCFGSQLVLGVILITSQHSECNSLLLSHTLTYPVVLGNRTEHFVTYIHRITNKWIWLIHFNHKFNLALLHVSAVYCHLQGALVYKRRRTNKCIWLIPLITHSTLCSYMFRQFIAIFR